jgi:hypothetical protein
LSPEKQLPPVDPLLGVPMRDTELDPAGLTLIWAGVPNMPLVMDLPCRLYQAAIERAIIIHRIPAREGDIGQDMGSYSREYNLEGLALTYPKTPGGTAEKDILDAMVSVVQLDSSGVGIGTLQMSDEAGNTVISLFGLAIQKYTPRWVGGFPQRTYYVLKMVQFL